MKLYISGPIKGITDAPIRFSSAADDLQRRGYDTLNPFDITPLCNCPAGTVLTDETAHYDCYMRGDLREMVTCHGVALLPGWERSRGALLEQFVALSVAMPVQPIREWLLAGVSGASR